MSIYVSLVNLIHEGLMTMKERDMHRADTIKQNKEVGNLFLTFN